MDDANEIKQLLARYYDAHAADDPTLIGHDAFAEPLLQRILVDELGGDSFEQAFLEGNLLHPQDGYQRVGQLAQAEYEVNVRRDAASARIVPGGPAFTLARVGDSWRILSFD
jgi:hypothetical protein